MEYYPELPVRSTKCAGMSNHMSQKKREEFNPPYVIAKAEPRNKVDPNAVKIMTLEGKKIGYLPAGLAKSFSPLIKQLGELRLDCRMVGNQLWMDVPQVVELRKKIAT